MKTAIYIEDGREQIVLTPETVLEKSVLEKMKARLPEVSFFSGSFYNTRGGYIRHGYYYENCTTSQDDTSLMILLDHTKPNEAEGVGE